MRSAVRGCLAGLLALGLNLPAAGTSANAMYEDALVSYRAHRYSEAYGKLLALAHAGDADSARIVLFMHQYGPALFGAYWDLNPDEFRSFTQLAARAETRRRPEFKPPWNAESISRMAPATARQKTATVPSPTK
jgi:hypothetical protein